MKKLLLVMFLTIFPVLAHGATYYVAKTGSDSNSCNSAQSPSTPKLTINAGAGCLSAGDTLIVKSGTYNELLKDVVPSGTAGSRTIVRSETQYGAIIQPDSSWQGQLLDGVGIVVFRTKNYITFDGFVVDAVNLRNTYLVYIFNGAHDITIINNEIKNGVDNNSTVNDNGIVTDHDGYNLLIGHNKIHDIGTGAVPGQNFYSYGTYFTAYNSIIEYNEIYNCSGHGIHMYNTTEQGIDNNIVRYNRIHDNGSRGILLASGGSNTAAYNNIIYRNGLLDGRQAINIGGYGSSSGNNTVYNNTLYNNVGDCIQIGSQYQGSNNNVVRNNICYQNGNNAISVNNGSGNTIDHNLIGTDPLFVNAAAADFSLQAGSPAINAGVVIPSLPYNGSAPDLGALESGAGVPPPTNLRLVTN